MALTRRNATQKHRQFRNVGAAFSCHRCLIQLFFASLLLCISIDGNTGSYTSSVVIVGENIVEARQRALREILQEVALSGYLEIKTATALINFVVHERALLDSSFRISKFAITHESVTEGWLTLSADVEANFAGNVKCSPVFLNRNIELSVDLPRPPHLTLESFRDISSFTELLQNELVMQTPMLAAEGEPSRYPPPYQLRIKMLPDTGKSNWLLSLKLTGIDGQEIISDTKTFDLANLQVSEKTSLGYATLRRRTLTVEARKLARDLANSFSQTARCLPAIALMPTPDDNGLITLQGIGDLPSRPPSIAFVARHFPVTQGGAINLLHIDGVIDILGLDNGRVYLRIPKALLKPSPEALFIFLL